MQHAEGNFKGVRNTNIYYQSWLPDGDVKAVLLVVHGLGEHCGRYSNVVNHFVPQGYAVYGLDHIGHGKSEGVREFVEKFEDFTITLKIFYTMIAERQSGKPIFLLGHSMGGTIATYYLLDHQDDFKGAILSAPLVRIGESVPPIAINVSKILAKIAPKMGVTDLDVNAISRDPKVVETYINDPLVFNGKTPARLGAELLGAIERIGAEADNIALPLIILQGAKDTLVEPSGAQMLYDESSSADKTIKIYPEMFHEVFNEPDRELAIKDVKDWLEKQLN
jgi:acylglycerol lipase